MTTYGIDVSDEMVKVAKLASPSSTFFVGNFVTHPFEHKFDVIFAQSFIHLFRKNEMPDIFHKFFSLLRDGRGKFKNILSNLNPTDRPFEGSSTSRPQSTMYLKSSY